MDFKEYYDKPQLFDWVHMDTFKDPDLSEDGCIRIEDFLDAESIYRQYPWMRHNIEVCLTSINNSALNGEGIRIVTLGGGEGTIFIARQMWDDALEGNATDHREFLAKAVVHELGHAVDDHNGDLEYSTREEINRAEEFANEFMNKWYRD
jgi:hypothetical protein